jgi:hypothetical protein
MLLVVSLAFIILWQIPEFRFVITGRISASEPTTLNVTIGGLLGSIQVNNYPINFTISPGLQPATSYTPKQREPEGIGFVTVKLNSSNNLDYNVYINASNLQLSGGSATIPVSNITVNTTCNGTRSSPPSIRLSNSFSELCNGSYEIFRENSTNIYFYLDIPAGQDNGTYFGDVWILVNSSDNPSQSHIWYGVSNTTTGVKPYIEFQWNSSNTPVDFSTLNPGAKSNATGGASPKGFPSSVISGAATNIFIDIYINGTDLSCLSGICAVGSDLIGVGNITYSNATSEATWPDNIRQLTSTFSAGPGGDFSNWGTVGNASNTYSFWNISIPIGQIPGDYGGYLYAKATEQGENP